MHQQNWKPTPGVAVRDSQAVRLDDAGGRSIAHCLLCVFRGQTFFLPREIRFSRYSLRDGSKVVRYVIVFINGASCTGKTSLARALQTQWSKWLPFYQSPLLYWGLDSVISQLPFALTGDADTADEGFPLSVREGRSTIGVGPLALRLSAHSAKYVRQLSRSGLDVVVDYVLLNKAMLADLRDELADVPVLFVGLFCDADILSARNEQRADRAPGLALTQQEAVHFCRDLYALELNSSHQDSDVLATQIIEHLSEQSVETGFNVASRGVKP